MRTIALAMLAALSLVPASAMAQTRLTTTVSTDQPGTYGGSLSLLTDGVYPPNGQYYQTDTVYNFPTTTAFDFTFAAPVTIGSFNITVDNNDEYLIVFYSGGSSVYGTFITASDGSIGGGVETFSSSTSLNGTYLPRLLGSPIQADMARVYAQGGDGLYSIGEVAFFTPAAATGGVPEPATWAMLLLGFGGIGAVMRPRHLASEAAFTARVRAIAASGDDA